MNKKIFIPVFLLVSLFVFTAGTIVLAQCPAAGQASGCANCQNGSTPCPGSTVNNPSATLAPAAPATSASSLRDIIKQYRGDCAAMGAQISNYIAQKTGNRISGTAATGCANCGCGSGGCASNTNCSCGSDVPNHVCTCGNMSEPAVSAPSTPESQPSTSSIAETAAASAYQEIEEQVLKLVNEYRVRNGLVELSSSSAIASVAREHSANMADGSVPFGHTGFTDRVKAIKSQIGGTAFAENVAMNNHAGDTAQTAFNGWINSAGHKKNILGNYNQTGIGVTRSQNGSYYFTQIFAR
jgi:uncharacterized protein YkwD